MLQRCREYRLKILRMSQRVPALHIAPAFSCLEIVDALYNSVMSITEDVFIMSKGHGVVSQYVVLQSLGILEERDLINYCTPDGNLGAHPDLGVHGIAASTGSLGHGLGMAVGVAYAKRLRGFPGKVYCLISDGECQEGSTWEAVMVASNLSLDNLTIIVDNNDYSGLAKLSETHPSVYPLVPKFEAFGLEAVLIDGHDSEMLAHYYLGSGMNGITSVVVCKTVKGKGVSFMENNPIWHYRSPTPAEYQQAVEEINNAD